MKALQLCHLRFCGFTPAREQSVKQPLEEDSLPFKTMWAVAINTNPRDFVAKLSTMIEKNQAAGRVEDMCLESSGQIRNGPLVCYFYLCGSLRNKLQTGTCINTDLSTYSIKSTSCDGRLEKTFMDVVHTERNLSDGVVTWCGPFLVDWVDWRNPVAAVYKPWFHSHKW